MHQSLKFLAINRMMLDARCGIRDVGILIMLTFFLGGCTSASKTRAIPANNNDVVILSLLVQDYLRKTDGRVLRESLQPDTLHRISNNFDKVELEINGGHISVYYKFSKSRSSEIIELSEKEKERSGDFTWTQKAMKNQYDGEIQFDYGERFYRLKKLITKRQ